MKGIDTLIWYDKIVIGDLHGIAESVIDHSHSQIYIQIWSPKLLDHRLYCSPSIDNSSCRHKPITRSIIGKITTIGHQIIASVRLDFYHTCTACVPDSVESCIECKDVYPATHIQIVG